MDQRAVEKIIELMIVLCEIEENFQCIEDNVISSKNDSIIDE